HVARACLRFPVILDGLVSGDLSLSAVRMLGPHLTDENHAAVLARAIHARREDVLKVVAELAPRADVPSSIRKVPVRVPVEDQPGPMTAPPLLRSHVGMTETPTRDDGPSGA